MSEEGRGPVPLDAVRMLLLPAVKHMQAMHPNKVMTIECDVPNDALLVRMEDTNTKRKIGFSIRRHDITSRRYLTSFQPNVVGLLAALGLPQDIFDARYPPENTLEAAVDITHRRDADVTAGAEQNDSVGGEHVASTVDGD